MTSTSPNAEAPNARAINARSIMRGGSIAGALFAALMLLLTAGGIAPGLPLLDTDGVDAAAAGTAPVGPLSMEPTSGNSDQLFAIEPSPAPGICPGDSANDGFAVNTFMTSVSNDPATLTYNAAGPVGAGFTQPLFDRFGTPIINKNTAPDTGRILLLGPAQFSVYGPGGVPAGSYFVGVACTKLGNTESFWSSTIEVTVDAATGGTSEIQIALVAGPSPTTTTTTTVAGGTTTTTVAGGTTTTTVAGGTTTTTVAGGTTTTTVAGGAAQTATLSPSTPTPGGTYRVTHPNCRVGDTITVTQAQSTPATQTATCAVPVSGLIRPQQAATVGTATVTFTAAPTAAGTYTVSSTGPNSGTRTATFTIVATTSQGVSSGGSPTSSSTGTIPATGSSTTSLIVWGVLLLVFGRMVILLGRKPKTLTGT
jgi:hypothetical protein